MKRRTVWTVLFALLLQVLAGSAWSWRTPQGVSPASHCHPVMVQDDSTVSTSPAVAQPVKGHAVSLHGDSHHCCALGLGIGVQPRLPALAQAAPDFPMLAWSSLSLRPDLRPPI